MHDREPHTLTAKRVRGEQQKGGGSRHQQLQAESTMEGLWSRLPDELVERVLPYLPVPDLCRFRSVCKRWTSLIGTPDFGTLCVQNASTGACLVVDIHGRSPHINHGILFQSWSIFDLNARRWYNVKHEFSKDYYFYRQTMDGGLVCTFVDAFTDDQRRTSTIHIDSIPTRPQILVISNLLGGTLKVLPNPPVRRIDTWNVHLKLVVDNRSHTYNVFLICMSDFAYPELDSRMCVYESSTNQWRIGLNPKPNLNLEDPNERFGPVVCRAWFQGLLYVLWVRESDLLAQLYTYNFLKDAWDDTGVQFCKRKFSVEHGKCDLVVQSDKRLFLVNRHLKDHLVREYQMSIKEWSLDITEISLADKALRMVVQLTPAEVYQKFCIEPDMMPSEVYTFISIQAFCYDRSILLMCKATGKVIEYNLVTGLWETLPPNPLESLHLRSIPHFSPRHYLWRFGNLMNGFLRLPNTPC